ncbi:MAG: hypothetical protein IT581_04810 [Verrucomicrobiales bacterium]|nr:hypothetical protein [Verrucomicrobiales bacterium]
MIRFVFRWLFRLLILAVVLATALFLARDALTREWILYRIRTVTGLETHLQSVRTAWLAGSITLSQLEVFNSAEFGGGRLLSIPDLHLELDTSRLWQRELRLNLARLHLAELNVVRNAAGATNLFALRRNVEDRTSAVDAAILSPPGIDFAGIDTLNLTLGTLRLIQMGPTNQLREIRVGVTNEILRNVRSEQDFTPLILRVTFRELEAQWSKDRPGQGAASPPVAPPAKPGARPAPNAAAPKR